MASALVATRKLFAANAGEGRRHDHDLPPFKSDRPVNSREKISISIDLPMGSTYTESIHISCLSISILHFILPTFYPVHG